MTLGFIAFGFGEARFKGLGVALTRGAAGEILGSVTLGVLGAAETLGVFFFVTTAAFVGLLGIDFLGVAFLRLGFFATADFATFVTANAVFARALGFVTVLGMTLVFGDRAIEEGFLRVVRFEFPALVTMFCTTSI